MKHIFAKFAASLALLAAGACAQASTLVKVPDLDAYWDPLSSAGSYVYANSFVAPSSGSVSAMGVWLLDGGSNLQFKIFQSVNGDVDQGPDASHALVSSAVLVGRSYSELTLVNASGLGGVSLVAGHTYWFALSTVGLGGSGVYTVGAHTPNSDGIEDNGSFWYSNAPDGLIFDGYQERPEMAFTLSISAVPEPSVAVMLAAGGLLLGWRARRRVVA